MIQLNHVALRIQFGLFFLCKNQRMIPLTTPYCQLEYRLPKEQHDDNLYIFVTSLTLGQSE